MGNQSGLKKLQIPLFLLLILVTLLTGLYQHDLSLTDETREAAIIVHMHKEGNYAVPILGAQLFLEKPPLYYWGEVLALKTHHFFSSEAVAITEILRLGSLFWALATLVATFLLTRLWSKYWSDREDIKNTHQTALIAVAILASCNGFLSNALTIRTDIALVFFTVLIALGFSMAYLEKNKYGSVIASLGLAGGFLSKGIIALALGGLIWIALLPFIYTLWQEKKFKTLIPHVIIPLIILLSIISVWLYFLIKQGGAGAWDQWFIENSLKRATGGGTLGHEEPGKFFYYFEPFFIYSLPWFLIWILALIGSPKSSTSYRYLMPLQCWVILPFCLLSIVATKRPIYALPLLPFLAIAISALCWNDRQKWLSYLLHGLSILIGIVTISAMLLPHFPIDFIKHLSTRFDFDEFIMPFWSMIVLVATYFFFFFFFKKEPTFRLCSALLLMMLVANILIFPSKNGYFSGAEQLQTFFSHQNDNEWSKTASNFLSEKTTGYIYTHYQTVPTMLPIEQLHALLKEKNKAYDYILIETDAVFQALPIHQDQIVAHLIKEQHSKYNSLYLIQLR